MKYVTILFALVFAVSCKEAVKKTETENKVSVEKVEEVQQNQYPEALLEVLNAHGGLQQWKNKKTLVFEIPKPDAREVHTIDLHSRKDKVEMPKATIGYDGQNAWVADNGDYKGNAAMYHNLMFYFYAMPFVLADNNINYETTQALEFEGKNYPGIRMSFDDGVGASPKDEYYLHYDPDTFQMAWLGYTATFGADERSDKVSWIRYNDWMTADDIVLPKSISWYTVEDGELKEPRNTVSFENISVSEAAKPSGFYDRPENARIAEHKG